MSGKLETTTTSESVRRLRALSVSLLSGAQESAAAATAEDRKFSPFPSCRHRRRRRLGGCFAIVRNERKPPVQLAGADWLARRRRRRRMGARLLMIIFCVFTPLGMRAPFRLSGCASGRFSSPVSTATTVAASQSVVLSLSSVPNGRFVNTDVESRRAPLARDKLEIITSRANDRC